MALVLREAATNIARHARATQARVALTVINHTLRLSIEDNGRGGVADHGNGLSGMCERVRALGGTLEVVSPRGQGTRLLIAVPLRTRTLATQGRDPDAVAELSPRQGRAT